ALARRCIWDACDDDFGAALHNAVDSDLQAFANLLTLCALLGLGLAVKSLAHVWEDLRDGRLVAVMTDFPVTRTGAIWAVAPPGRAMMPKARVLADFLTGKYGSPAYWETDYRQAGALVG
ncbi:MAG: LysR substrate-binding domain-containing protein, partial [Pannonibacter indicus]